jgi:hypothetical protein
MLCRCAERGHDTVVWSIGFPSIRLGVLGGLGGARSSQATLTERGPEGERKKAICGVPLDVSRGCNVETGAIAGADAASIALRRWGSGQGTRGLIATLERHKQR